METRPDLTHDRSEKSCDDCFFRHAELCAIPGNTPCPTFRAVAGALGGRRRSDIPAPRPELRVAQSAAA